MSIVSTMQCWNDQVQTTMPGFRDRIVHISHAKKEGGLNLNMEKEVINTLANSGRTAADELTTAFAGPGNSAGYNAWDNHKRIRMRSLLSSIEQQSLRVHKILQGPAGASWLEDVQNANPPSYSFNTPARIALAKKVLDAMDALGKELQYSGLELTSDAPRPPPDWRPTPRV
jgi:hypothetical protein